MTVGRTSPYVVVLLRISESFGKIRVGLLVGPKDRKIGALVEVGSIFAWGPRSHCSQLYVRLSPSGSVALPVSSKGVPDGILLLLIFSAFAFATGVLLVPLVVPRHMRSHLHQAD